MRIGLIFGVLAMTALVFFTAIQSVPVQASRTVAQPSSDTIVDKEEHAKAVEENTGLRTALAELEEKNTTLLSTLEDARAEKEQLEIDVAALQSATAQSAELEANERALSQSLAALEEELAATQKASHAFQTEAQAKTAEIIQTNDKIATLEANIAELERAGKVAAQKTLALEAKLQDAQIASENTPADTAIVAERDAAINELAALKQETEEQAQFTAEMVELVAAMKSRISALQADASEQETTIAALSAVNQVAPTPAISPAAICQARSDELTVAIDFTGGTTSISEQTANALNELTDIVAECVGKDVLLEIEGHTDNSGRMASNLLLSNGRANAVRTFLADKGIPTGSMRAVGYGASDPIADNSTPEGRSQNARIVFDWEMK